MRTPKLTAREVVERLDSTRRLLTIVLENVNVGLVPDRVPKADAVLEELQTLEAYAERKLRRADVAAYAADVRDYAQMVLGELLAAAPAISDERKAR